jgi:N-acetylglucosaminyl-diphospho-decaprenol L-rhamnosyltransferase
VDNASRHRDPALRRSHPEVAWLALPANRAAAGRNLGARAAGCEYTAFADDDSAWESGSLAAGVAAMEADPRLALLAARVLVAEQAVPDPVSEAMAAGPLDTDLRASPTGRRAVTGALACATLVRTRAFLASGGFPEGVGVGGEEQFLVWGLLAAGWRCGYAPEAVVRHWPGPGRDPAARQANAVRNDLWAAWSLLPGRAALRRSARAVAAGWRASSPGTVRGVAAAVSGAGWAVARRAPVPPAVAAAVELLG